MTYLQDAHAIGITEDFLGFLVVGVTNVGGTDKELKRIGFINLPLA